MKHSGSASVNVQKSLDLGGSIFILPVEECNVLHTELNQVNNNQLSWADSSHSIVDVLCVQEHCTSPAVSSLLLSDQKVNDTKQPTWRTSQTFIIFFKPFIFSILISVGEATAEYCIQLCTPKVKRHAQELERVHRRAIKVSKGWEHLSCQERPS